MVTPKKEHTCWNLFSCKAGIFGFLHHFTILFGVLWGHAGIHMTNMQSAYTWLHMFIFEHKSKNYSLAKMGEMVN